MDCSILMTENKYIIQGMTCSGCINKVSTALMNRPEIQDVDIQLAPQISTINAKNISFSDLEKIIKGAGSYNITKTDDQAVLPKEETSFVKTYKPLILIFLYILTVSTIASWGQEIEVGMRYFMAGFFLVFSFFKLLDLSGFASSYSTYDLLAKKWKAYGYIYPFIELVLGLAFLMNIFPRWTLLATVVVMGFSSIGVIKSVLNKQEIKCACLGTVFNLPMSTVTIVEDLLMVGMALMMI